MTPAQLDHLRLIDAHLKHLLEDIAAKRTPGEWEAGPLYHVADLIPTGEIVVKPGIARMVKSSLFQEKDAAFIASCAGNAEAGWKATRAAIAEVVSSHKARYESWCLVCQELNQDPGKIEDYPLPPWSDDIIAAFPLESLKS